MTELHIERSGGFIGITEQVDVDDLDAASPTVTVTAFRSSPQHHALDPQLCEELRTAREQLRADTSGSGGHPHGADRYVWTITFDGAHKPLVFHDPVTNPGAQAMSTVAAQLFAAS